MAELEPVDGVPESFLSVTIVKDQKEYAVIKLKIAKLKKKDKVNVNVKLEDKLLKFLVESEGTTYWYDADVTADGEIDRKIEKTVDDGYVEVKITKKKPFTIIQPKE